MADRLAILFWAATPDRPELCVTPLVHALAARALDAEVEIHFAGPAVRLLIEGFADTLYPTPAHERSIGAFIRETIAEGVEIRACSMALAAWVRPEETLMTAAQPAGATVFVVRALDPAWTTLVF